MIASDRLAEVKQRFAELAEYSFENMRLIHSPPYRSLYFGGAGVAYAFWRAACLLDEPEWLHHARFWIDHVAAAPQDDQLMKIPESPGETVKIEVYDSLFFGDRGVYFVQALIARAEDNQSLLNRALRSFTAPEKERLANQELIQGIAGRLVGSALLLDETGGEHLKEYGDTLANDLLGIAQGAQEVRPWPDGHRLGLAHGRAGNYYALLLWSKKTGFGLPEWILARLRQFAGSGKKQAKGITWPIDVRDENKYMNTWCNGAPGFVLLWCLAYNLYDDPLFLETARATGEYIAHEHDHVVGHLCCGAAGAGYAFLSLRRVDPAGDWLDHAHHYFSLAARGLLDKNCRLGLYRGSAGIACLALDLLNPEDARHPAVEG